MKRAFKVKKKNIVHHFYRAFRYQKLSETLECAFKLVHILRARILHSYICSVFAILNKRTTHFLEHLERQVDILTGGNKGGSYKNFHFENVPPGIVSSAYNVPFFRYV